jgi:hypothetical protein
MSVDIAGARSYWWRSPVRKRTPGIPVPECASIASNEESIAMSKAASLLTVVLVMAVTIASAQADDDQQQLIAKGIPLLEALPEVPGDLDKTYCFEVLHKTERRNTFRAGGSVSDERDEDEDLVITTVGWCMVSFKSAEIDGERRYLYSSKYAFNVPRGPDAVGQEKVTLDRYFSPVSVGRKYDMVSLYNGNALIRQKLTVGKNKMLFRFSRDGINAKKKKVDLVPGRFVFLVEPLLETLDFEEGQKFALIGTDLNARNYKLQVFDVTKPEEKSSERGESKPALRIGVTEYRVYKPDEDDEEGEDGSGDDAAREEQQDDGELRFVRREDADESEYYILDDQGRLIESGGFLRGVSMKRCSESHLETLKKRFGK